MPLEAEKSIHLPSAGWRPRQAGGVIQGESEGLRTRGADGVNPSSRAGEDAMLLPSKQAGEEG